MRSHQILFSSAWHVCLHWRYIICFLPNSHNTSFLLPTILHSSNFFNPYIRNQGPSEIGFFILTMFSFFFIAINVVLCENNYSYQDAISGLQLWVLAILLSVMNIISTLKQERKGGRYSCTYILLSCTYLS